MPRGTRPTPERAKRWERKSDARPGELTAAALRVFAARGYAGTRLEDVAADAGVSKATVYLYFENKARLFEAMLREQITPRVEAVEALLGTFQGTTEELLARILDAFRAALDGPMPSVVKLVLSESNQFPEVAQIWGNVAITRFLGLIRGVLARGIARGELRSVAPETVAPLVAAPFVLLSLWRVALAPHVTVPVDPDAILAAHRDLLLHGLLTPPAAPAEAPRPPRRRPVEPPRAKTTAREPSPPKSPRKSSKKRSPR